MFEESRELDERELELVVGGSGNPIDPIENATGDVEASGKATPILM
jgi:hypothetical protein